eukprot:GHVQ01021862.1.p1 GENE.GHVQ01021862.1~~GHVQ01021862.1.p1  ORF type:complete len:240 (-),score=27.35 GHVQ01021862.1:133-852(-)
MDFQNRVGHKTGSGAPASAAEAALERRERLKRLALESFDLNKDPYLMRNHLGQIECKLCLTLHSNESSYLSHTQGKKHQMNLARRAAKEKANSSVLPQPLKSSSASSSTTKIKIGRPGYRVTKLRDSSTGQKAMLFELDYPEIESLRPRHRFMSAYEQRMEHPANPRYQYLLLAADPYETVAFKIPNMEIDRGCGKMYVSWDQDKHVYTLQIYFKEREERTLPALPHRPSTFLPIGARW